MLLFERSKTWRFNRKSNEEGKRPPKWLSDMDKNVKLGKYDPISLGMWLSKLLLEISNSDKFWWGWIGNWKVPERELLTKWSSFRFVLFSNNQIGNPPLNFRLEKSISWRLYWWRRNLGKENAPPYPLPDKRIHSNWNFGAKLCSSNSSTYISLLLPSKYLSCEWLRNELNETGIWKWLSESDNPRMDVRLVRGEKEMSPIKLL